MSRIQPLILPGEAVWSEGDAEALRSYLTTPSGQRFLQVLVYQRPLVTAPEGARRGVQQDERTGFEGCISEILSLAAGTPLTELDRAAQTLDAPRR